MYKSLLILITFFLPLGFLNAQVIQEFASDINLKSDGSFLVTENITYNFGDIEKHGIFRDISKQHPQSATAWYKTRLIEIEVKNVTADNEAIPFLVTDTGDSVNIRIGDPDSTITGVHTYTISYEVLGGLSYLDDSTVELYWNVTGHDWPVSILSARANVIAPEGVISGQRSCYTGVLGEFHSCREIKASSTVVTFISPQLAVGGGLTIAQELNPTAVEKMIVEETPKIWLWLVGILFWLIALGVFVYRYKTAHKPAVTVISQYEPYEDFKPMFAGVLIDGRLDARDITAGIVYLAEQGFITITKTSRKVMLLFEVDDYDVTLKKSASEAETEFLEQVLTLLFGETSTVGESVALSKLRSDTSKQRVNHKILNKLRQAVINDLETRGFYERLARMPTLIAFFIVFVFAFIFLVPLLAGWVGGFAIPLLVVIFSLPLALAFMYQRRTRKGYEALNHLKGFKEFLSVTDKERFKFHNAPQKNPEQFMEYLPYAIAFGVEKEWAEVFQDIALPNPDWYQGNTGTTFSAAAFSRDLGAFSTSFTSSTGSSGASGGGGSSGGGGGGGGGGSW